MRNDEFTNDFINDECRVHELVLRNDDLTNDLKMRNTAFANDLQMMNALYRI